MNALGPSPAPQWPPDPSGEPARRDPPAATADECAHCGLALGPHHRPEDGPFCCSGCRTVYLLIHEEGLDRYYDLKQCAISPPAGLRPESFAWLDDRLASAPTLGPSSVRRLRLDVQGVHCAACVWLLEQLFARHAAGHQLRINPALGTVDLLWDPEAGELRDYLHEVEQFGYRFGPPRKEAPRQSRDLLVRMGISIAAALNVMMFSLSYYLGLAPQDGLVYRLFGQLNLGLATLTVAVGGWPFLTAAVRGVRRRVVHLDLPIALGMVLAYLGSTVSYLRHGPEAAYFDTITIFVALMLVGRWLQERVLERNRNTLLSSGGVADLYARRFEDGELRAVSATGLRTGDELWVAPGDLVPVEGLLMQRAASVSLDWITGEADPLACQPGDRVPAGAFNAGDQGFRLAVTEDFSASRLNDLISAGAAPQERGARTRAEHWWHRVATVYVLLVLSLATLGFVFWLSAGLQRAVEVSVAVLVVTCPCALGLAVPLSRELAHAALRRHGVLLRRSGFLDRALEVRQVVFDKTGTLTRGQLTLSAPSRRALLTLSPEHRTILWNLASRSTHPVSRCVAAALSLAPVEGSEAGRARVVRDEMDSTREITGEGLSWRDGDREWRFGRPRFAAEGAGPEPSDAAAHAVFALDGGVLARLAFEEDIRRDAATEVRRLREMGYRIHLLSGDLQEKVMAVARSLGIASDEARGELSPEQKAAAVRALDRRDTLMVGDGLNDSLSFDEALCSATPAVDRAILPQKADFYFLGDGVAAIRRSLQTALRLKRVQRDNLIFAAVYNAVAVGLCLAGVVSPVVAAILMPLSSVSIVLVTSARMGRKEAAWMS